MLQISFVGIVASHVLLASAPISGLPSCNPAKVVKPTVGLRYTPVNSLTCLVHRLHKLKAGLLQLAYLFLRHDMISPKRKSVFAIVQNCPAAVLCLLRGNTVAQRQPAIENRLFWESIETSDRTSEIRAPLKCKRI